MQQGIYTIINTANGWRYIGSSERLEKRLYEHRHRLQCGEHYNSRLQQDWVTFGESAFIFAIIEETHALPPVALLRREQQEISTSKCELYNSIPAFTEPVVVDKDLFSIKDVALALGVTYVTAFGLVKQGVIVPCRVAQLGRQERKFFNPSDVERVRRQRSGEQIEDV